MSFGVFNDGLRWQQRKAFRNEYGSTTLSLGLYTNARDSLTRRNVFGDITPCSGAGYAPISLLAAGWAVSIEEGDTALDDVVLLDRPNLIFTSNGAWGIVRGMYVFDAANGIAIMWRDLAYDYDMVNGAKLLADFLSEASGD